MSDDGALAMVILIIFFVLIAGPILLGLIVDATMAWIRIFRSFTNWWRDDS